MKRHLRKISIGLENNIYDYIDKKSKETNKPVSRIIRGMVEESVYNEINKKMGLGVESLNPELRETIETLNELNRLVIKELKLYSMKKSMK